MIGYQHEFAVLLLAAVFTHEVDVPLATNILPHSHMTKNKIT